MEDRVCMNGACASSNSLVWKKGWSLRSGELATLCDNCGDAYKQLIFCEMFHSEDTGWRECSVCGKRLHCGCIASSSLLEVLDTGGVTCIGCTKSSKLPYTPCQEKTEVCALSTAGINQCMDKIPSKHSGDDDKNFCLEHLTPSQNVDTTAMKPEEYFPRRGEIGHETLSSFNISSADLPKDFEAFQECMIQTNLSIGLSASSNSNPLPRLIAEEREFCTSNTPLKQVSKPFHLSPSLPTSVFAAGIEKSSGSISQLRVARPPVEGRVKNQLLPRYWPRITDLELQQISGDSNSTVVPLFEKVLSASDAGRIGRLVLPKACAEAYFPLISQPEGLPLRIQDVKGNEWVFQFRFWPNNNSRMYVLEGVTPCIQSMQLQAGDTVTFSRIEPEGKLLMGFRKASNNILAQQMNRGPFQSDPPLTAAENPNLMSGYSGLLCPLKGIKNSSVAMLSMHAYNTENNESMLGDNLLPQTQLFPERKRNRNIGLKSKRLLIDGHDAMELKLSWEEVQDMLCPPPSVTPSTITVEDHEFEEFEEPPVFGKRSIFIVRVSGEHEQWAQCDSCFKWRKLPVDFLLSSKWTCPDNVQDQTRCSCAAPDELGCRELESLLRMNKEFKKQRLAASLKSPQADASEDLGALANASGVDGDSEPTYVAAITTKHPRHRPGCSCIVCIQPPSGKGKHKPTCVCNVCLTVKRRFKTLMMRKKKRQSEREAEIAQRNQFASADKDEVEVDSIPSQVISQLDNGRSKSEPLFSCQSDGQSQEYAEVLNGGGLDLNCCPGKEHAAAPSRTSMIRLLHEASLPLDTYLRQNGLARLVNSEQQAISPGETAQEDHGLSTTLPGHEEGRTLNEEKATNPDIPLL
ncbi:B3 domain-containing transcription repressor VAL2-like isoform X2 [Primulina eburnea]|uniref:B3 domain-containing transcription repressor VAL2-like isoform X2 n=1 Tax=Primulina eburnea TaxID=1245227 RepID=UPI003C6C3D60